MKKLVLLLFAGLLLVLASLAPVDAQFFHRMGHANRSRTMKAEHSNKHVRHRDKQRVRKQKPDKNERRRHKEAQRQQKRRAEGAPARAEAPEPEKTTP